MFDIINETPHQIDITYIEEMLKDVVKKKQLENCLFNVIIVDEKEIQKINKEYRGKDYVTDVISFALEDAEKINTPVRILGDIYICYEKIISQSKEYNHSFKREFSFLTIHGLLHLLGYDHITEEESKEMFDLQEQILASYNIVRSEI